MTDTTLDWHMLTTGHRFIVNLGFAPSTTVKIPGGPPMIMGQFAAFQPLPTDGEKHQIIEVSGDLEYLKEKYSIPHDLVFDVNQQS